MPLLPLPGAEGCEDTKTWDDLAPEIIATVKYTNTFSTSAPAVLHADPKGVVEDLCLPAPELDSGGVLFLFFVLFCFVVVLFHFDCFCL